MTSKNKFVGPFAFFNPEGRLLQVEYAAKAVSSSFTVIGLRGKNSVLLAVDKIVRSSLHEPDADGRIFSVERNLGMAIAGFTPDGYLVVEAAREEVAKYRQSFDSAIPVSILSQRVAAFIHASTRNPMRRPLGVSVILASWDENVGSQLYKVEPCGAYAAYYACAMGRTKTQAVREFDKHEKMLDMGTEELVKSAGEIIYKSHYDRRRREFLFEMGIVGMATGGMHRINPTHLTEMARAAGEEVVTEESSSSDDPFI